MLAAVVAVTALVIFGAVCGMVGFAVGKTKREKTTVSEDWGD